MEQKASSKPSAARTAQEYGSELNAITFAFRAARETGMPHYAIETVHGWLTQERKPMLRAGKVWECHANGDKCYG